MFLRDPFGDFHVMLAQSVGPVRQQTAGPVRHMGTVVGTQKKKINTEPNRNIKFPGTAAVNENVDLQQNTLQFFYPTFLR